LGKGKEIETGYLKRRKGKISSESGHHVTPINPVDNENSLSFFICFSDIKIIAKINE